MATFDQSAGYIADVAAKSLIAPDAADCAAERLTDLTEQIAEEALRRELLLRLLLGQLLRNLLGLLLSELLCLLLGDLL